MNGEEVIQAKAEEIAAKILGEKVQVFEELLEKQKKMVRHGEYQIGIYNGLVLGRSILTGEKPKYYTEGGDKDEG